MSDESTPERPALLPTVLPPPATAAGAPPVGDLRRPFRYDLLALGFVLAVACALFFMAMRTALTLLQLQLQKPGAAGPSSPLATALAPAPPPAAAPPPPPTIVLKCEPPAKGPNVYVDYGLERDLQRRRAPLMFPQLVRGDEVEVNGADGRAQYDELYPVYDDDLALIGVDNAPTSAFAFAPSAHIHDTPMRENTDSSFVAVGGPASYDDGTFNASPLDDMGEAASVAAAAEGDSPAFDLFARAAVAGESAMEIGGSITRPIADTIGAVAPPLSAPRATAPAALAAAKPASLPPKPVAGPPPRAPQKAAA